MKHVIRSCILSLIGLSALAVLPILFITWLQVPAGPNPDGFIYQFFNDYIIHGERLAKFDMPFSVIAKNLFNLVTNLNISLLALSYIVGLVWSGGSPLVNSRASASEIDHSSKISSDALPGLSAYKCIT